MSGHIVELHSYPVKGLSAVSHERVDLRAGQGFPGDREFGLAKASSGFDPANPTPLPKSNFLALYGYEALASLETRFDPETRVLVVRGQETGEQRFALADEAEQARASAFFAELLALSDADRPQFATAHPHRFTDVSVTSEQMMHAISLVNLASVAALAERVGTPIDVARFRANIVVDGWPPFAELEHVGQRITLGDTTFTVLQRTRRCPATQVNPATAERDLNVPALIKAHFGHVDMGVYIEASASGTLHCDDPAVLG
ncbi:MAG: MOSC domain-containing protein [Pseudomonadota bacterium]